MLHDRISAALGSRPAVPQPVAELLKNELAVTSSILDEHAASCHIRCGVRMSKPTQIQRRHFLKVLGVSSGALVGAAGCITSQAKPVIRAVVTPPTPTS